MSETLPPPVSPGDRLNIRAATWNAITEMVKRDRQGQPADARKDALRWGGVVEALALNDTGGDMREYAPATVTDAGGYELPTNDTSWQRQPLLTIGAPAATTDFVVVTLEAIPDGQIGKVAVTGVVLCDVDTTAGDDYGSPAVGDTARLTGGASGAIRILHVPAGVGSTKRCVVSLSGQGGTAEREQPVNFCVVKNGSGYVTDLKVTWLKTDGTLECETVAECAGDCADMWYCVDGVATAVAVGDAPPAGTAVIGPYRTEAEALAICPTVASCDTFDYLIDETVPVEFRNPTGCLLADGPATLNMAYVSEDATYCAYSTQVHTFTAASAACTGPIADPDFTVKHNLFLNKTGSAGFYRNVALGVNGTFDMSFTGANGFSNIAAAWSGVTTQTAESGSDTRLSGPLNIGTITLLDGGVSRGTVEVWLG